MTEGHLDRRDFFRFAAATVAFDGLFKTERGRALVNLGEWTPGADQL